MGSAQNGNGDSTDNLDTSVTVRGTWAVEYPRDHLPDLPLDQVLWQAFEFHARRDQMNAAGHVSAVRWSPLTFRLADQLDALLDPERQAVGLSPGSMDLLDSVQHARGAYAEDAGR
jgi:hypothetical protein